MHISSDESITRMIGLSKIQDKKLSDKITRKHKVVIGFIRSLGVRTPVQPVTSDVLVISDKAYHEIIKRVKRFENEEPIIDKITVSAFSYNHDGDKCAGRVVLRSDSGVDGIYVFSKTLALNSARNLGIQLAIKSAFGEGSDSLVRRSPDIGMHIKTKVTKTPKTEAHKLAELMLSHTGVKTETLPVNKEVLAVPDKAFDAFMDNIKKIGNDDIEVSGYSILGIEYNSMFVVISSDKTSSIIARESAIELPDASGSNRTNTIVTFDDLQNQVGDLFSDRYTKILSGLKNVVKSANKVVKNGDGVSLDYDYSVAMIFDNFVIGFGVDSHYIQVNLKNSRLRDDKKSKRVFFLRVCVYDPATKKYLFKNHSMDFVATLYDNEGPVTKTEKLGKLSTRLSKVIGHNIDIF